MGRVKSILASRHWRLLALAILPAGAVFAGTMVVFVQWLKHRILTMHGASGAAISPHQLDAAFSGGYILALGLVAFMLTILVTGAILNGMAIRPYREIGRLAREMVESNYGVRAPITPGDTKLYRELAENVNRLADSLQRTDQLRREVTANLAHEIRTPLTNLQGYVEALRDEVIEPNHETLVSVHEEVMRLVRLVDALHELARADALRHRPLEFVLTDLDDLVMQLVRVVQPMAEAKGISLHLDAGAGQALVPVHSDSIAQVVRNLLRNAVQYTDPGGIIRVQTVTLPGVYRFNCINTGSGIDPEDLPLIFNRFFRTGRAKQRIGNGVGIGLALAKELVETHGGRIGAESKAGWTTLWFELPLEPGTRVEVRSGKA